ncbi:hypothetical protein [Hyphomonas sp. UBA4494]|jgi:hypothetical protein|uniref:hypothetical protein n=1 Tax=Hyphomonas sp. UBA4494 TaxID=1946631 RepID=UPI0025BFFCCD|nr:hypothetical protein [Hyphomonas sp. UBA4494]
MKSPFPLAVHSLTRFWWDAADYLASAAQKRLGLCPVAAKPFLPRAELEDLAGLVGFLEAILRRLFCLAALELGPLPRLNAKPQDPDKGAKHLSSSTISPAAEPASRRPRYRIPRFRLIEATKATPATPPRARFRTGPRIRFLDEETPVDLRDYPASPTDILPAGKLVRRLLAVNHALDHAAEYVARMRQIMASASPVLKRAVPPVFKTRKLRHLQQDSACQLHAATWDFLSPDTS